MKIDKKNPKCPNCDRDLKIIKVPGSNSTIGNNFHSTGLSGMSASASVDNGIATVSGIRTRNVSNNKYYCENCEIIIDE